MSNIYISLTGGLGNQLYIAATALSLSKILNEDIILDTTTYKKYKLHKLLVNKLFPLMKYESNNMILRGYPLLSKNKRFFKLINEFSASYDERILKNLSNRNFYCDYYLKGYFQSLSYFSHILPEIKNQFYKNLKLLNNELNYNEIKNILSKTLTIHIRRKDKLLELNKSIYGYISKKGYQNIISSSLNNSEYKYLLIVGDDQDFNDKLKDSLRLNVKIITSKYISNKVSAFQDLFYMINSKGLILNNSSFSLWAGYVSNSKNIFYPDLLFPHPKHNSISNLNNEDLIMPHWKIYKNQY